MNEDGGKKKGGKTSFDILTVLGIVVALGLIFFGISFKSEPPVPVKTERVTEEEFAAEMTKYEEEKAKFDKEGGSFRPWTLTDAFIDVPSIAIVVGGTIGALLIAFPMSVVATVPKLFKIAFLPNKYDPQDYIEQIVNFAKEARVKGLLSLEDKLSEAQDPFLKSSLMLVVDSVEPEKVHNLLQAELTKLDERHSRGRAFFESGGAYAPGFGMIGTLIGLIIMLGNMDDPNSIGPAMAVALLTTMYGSMLANIIFSPIANKLGLRHEEEYLCRELICEGVEAIQAGENPKFIEEKLNLLIQQKKGKGKKAKAAE